MTENFDNHDEQDSQAQRRLTLDVLQRIRVTAEELWVYYLSMGGDLDEYEIDAYLHGLMYLPAIERDMLSQAVNEMLDDVIHGPRAPFSTETRTSDPSAGGFHLGPASRASTGSNLVSVAYSSVPTQAFSGVDLAELLRSSRHRNSASHLTGLLLYRKRRFLQVLEGPEQAVRDRMRSIAADPRHTAVRILVTEKRHQRQFPDWTMRWQPISDTLSDEVPGIARAFAEEGHHEDVASAARATKEVVHWFQRHP